jgi:hypothetical protein
MANELSVHIDVLHKYQFWIFSYPTGKPFPSEAANLRRQLVELRSQIDPQQRDPLLDQMVLIGHSMGGLISKMQITTSDGELASIVFGKPVRQLRIPENLQDDVIGTFEFEPSTQIQRVIFMGTPHRGSKLASLGVGRLASRIVKEPTELVTRFNEIAQLNQDAMGLKRIPSSVDLLQPDNEMLNAIYELPVNPQVRIHTVLGTSHGGHLGIEKSDGVVPVSSAQHPGSESELHVKATHTKLHHKPESVVEVVRILRDHAVVSGQVEYSGSMATRRTLTRRQ